MDFDTKKDGLYEEKNKVLAGSLEKIKIFLDEKKEVKVPFYKRIQSTSYDTRKASNDENPLTLDRSIDQTW